MLTKDELAVLKGLLVSSNLPIYKEGSSAFLLYEKIRIMQEAFLYYENLPAVKNILFANRYGEPDAPVVNLGCVKFHKEDLTKNGAARVGTALYAGIKCALLDKQQDCCTPYIKAIKWTRNFCECRLKEAKTIVDLTQERIRK